MTREDPTAKLEAHFDALAREHGDSPHAAQWSSRETQEARMSTLIEVADLSSAKVLDFGCGTGHLLGFMRERGFRGEYVGYDLSSAMLDVARAKFPDARFERRNILESPPEEQFDYVLVSGVFNNRVDDSWSLMQSLLRALYGITTSAVAFNALSTYVDFFQDDLFYADPDAVFRFCKEELSPLVTLRHDYQVKPGVLPFEFTVYVRRSAIPPRPHQNAR